MSGTSQIPLADRPEVNVESAMPKIREPETNGRHGLASRPEVYAVAQLLAKAKLMLADYYALGEHLRLLAANPAVAGRRTGWRKELAKLLSSPNFLATLTVPAHHKARAVSEATLNKCLQFRKLYAPHELDHLKKMDVTWGKLTVAFALKDRTKRHRLLQEKGLSDQDLQRKIQADRGRRRGAAGRGRRPRGTALWRTSTD